MSKLKSILVAAVIALSGFALPATSVFAEEGPAESSDNSSSSWIQVTPVSSRVVLRPGNSMEYSMIVSNIGTEKFNYSVYTAPYSIVDEAYNVSFSNETNRTQLSRWIKFIKEDGSLTDKYTGSLDPDGKQVINYRITVPEDVPAGGQYATIFAQTDEMDTKDTATSGVKTVSRIGMIVYGRTNGETVDSAEIMDYNIPGFMTQGPIKATAKVKNSGNTDFEVRYSLTVKSIIGNELFSEEEARNVLPETERRVDKEWENTSSMGVFWVTYKVSALDQTVETTKLVFVLPIYMIVIMIILLTILIVWIIMLVRKRKERKARLKV